MAGTMRSVQGALRGAQRLNGVRPRWPEQLNLKCFAYVRENIVSMESGLDGRNNLFADYNDNNGFHVSMESGLDGRNNEY